MKWDDVFGRVIVKLCLIQSCKPGGFSLPEALEGKNCGYSIEADEQWARSSTGWKVDKSMRSVYKRQVDSPTQPVAIQVHSLRCLLANMQVGEPFGVETLRVKAGCQGLYEKHDGFNHYINWWSNFTRKDPQSAQLHKKSCEVWGAVGNPRAEGSDFAFLTLGQAWGSFDCATVQRDYIIEPENIWKPRRHGTRRFFTTWHSADLPCKTSRVWGESYCGQQSHMTSFNLIIELKAFTQEIPRSLLEIDQFLSKALGSEHRHT